MHRILVYLYDPIHINSYGFFIALGIIIAISLMRKHSLFKKLSLEDHIYPIMLLAMLSSIIGGRVAYLVENPINFPLWYHLWEGGFSILGAITGSLCAIVWYASSYHIPRLLLLDLIALHAPLLQSIARIGCFCAGCCYGIPTYSFLKVIYTDPESLAPLGCGLHPTQLYSAAGSLFIFGLMYLILQKIYTKPGQLVGSYLVLMSTERFLIDFFRESGASYHAQYHLSPTQLIAIALFVLGLFVFFWAQIHTNKKS